MQKTENQPNGISLPVVLAIVLVTLALGFGLGAFVKSWPWNGWNNGSANVFIEDGSPAKGSKTAKITIVEFSDYQCPFCARVEPTIKKLMTEYGSDLKVIFKQHPLDKHPNAIPASRAALAALEQGASSFWAFHDEMFKNQEGLSTEGLNQIAADLAKQGRLNLKQWQKDLAGNVAKYDAKIKSDEEEAEKNGVSGTPAFLINGHLFKGAQPYENFKKMITEILAGTYKATVRKAPIPTPAPEAEDTTRRKMAIGGSPMKGPMNAKVTLMAFSDFQCPFCSKVLPTLKQLEVDYPTQLRIVFKQLPLSFHANAHLAAEASLAAHAQGKFWPMHDKMFANQNALSEADLNNYAKEVGVEDLKKFAAALKSGKYKKDVDAELAAANKVGIRGTPTFLINGKEFVGARPVEAFKKKIDEAIVEADALIKAKKIPAGLVYAALMKDAKAEIVQAAPEAEEPTPEDDKTVYRVVPGDGPRWGNPKAKVTIVEFSDFQCPFCSRVIPAVKQIKQEYAGKVQIVWRNYPLTFHKHAGLAAEASLAAHEQGKFWEMHDILFNNQTRLVREDLERYAQNLGLDMSRFKSALDTGKFKDVVNKDVEYGNSLPGGGIGTPTFFINGHKIAGAYPFEAFKKIIDKELAKK